jgi:predicted lipoprotein with Yx(FWY)xxD motif
MRARLIVVLIAVTAMAGAIAGSTMATEQAPRGVVTAKSSQYGRILYDGRGFVLYGFTRDPRGKSACSGACATAWPPYIVRSRPHASGGVNRARIGTITRADGRLYYYVGDRQPGQILCQNVTEFGGVWRVVRPNGSLVG